MKIPYTTHTGGNTTYIDISASHTSLIRHQIQRGLNEMNERANYETPVRNLLLGKYEAFGKHGATNNREYNCLGSFLGGLCNQIMANPKKDFSIKNIPGLELASRVMNEYLGNQYIVFEFEDAAAPKAKNTNTLFEGL